MWIQINSSRGKHEHFSRKRDPVKDLRARTKLTQVALKYEYVSGEKQLKDLDLRLFVAGELGLILGNEGKRVSEAVRISRMKLLEKIMYHAGNYQWQAVKTLYLAIVKEIYVRKTRKWESWDRDITRMEKMILIAHPIMKYSGTGGTQSSIKHKKRKPQWHKAR